MAPCFLLESYEFSGAKKMYFLQISKGISLDASWHAEYADSAYVFVGGLDYRLTEGDVITIFSQVRQKDIYSQDLKIHNMNIVFRI